MSNVVDIDTRREAPLTRPAGYVDEVPEFPVELFAEVIPEWRPDCATHGIEHARREADKAAARYLAREGGLVLVDRVEEGRCSIRVPHKGGRFHFPLEVDRQELEDLFVRDPRVTVKRSPNFRHVHTRPAAGGAAA